MGYTCTCTIYCMHSSTNKHHPQGCNRLQVLVFPSLHNCPVLLSLHVDIRKSLKPPMVDLVSGWIRFRENVPGSRVLFMKQHKHGQKKWCMLTWLFSGKKENTNDDGEENALMMLTAMCLNNGAINIISCLISSEVALISRFVSKLIGGCRPKSLLQWTIQLRPGLVRCPRKSFSVIVLLDQRTLELTSRTHCCQRFGSLGAYLRKSFLCHCLDTWHMKTIDGMLMMQHHSPPTPCQLTLQHSNSSNFMEVALLSIAQQSAK